MDSEVSVDTTAGEVNELAETSEDGSQALKRKHGKVPKRVHKSEREKMKREHLNDLFLALANALGQSELNNGKASVLAETNRLLKELHTQMDNLRKENAALLSESQYVSTEKEDLKDETIVLESEVERLRIELHERMLSSKPSLNAPPIEQSPSPFLLDSSLSQTPYGNPLYVIPVCPDLSAYAERGATQLPTPTVSKPHARYPTPSDSWPSQLLARQHDST